ncbi:MAG: hypothetical protein CHACPFDD_02542 [Phycisphaerae bacterium]|nr:hypothetical protein [Phycisphaerae bacterium]
MADARKAVFERVAAATARTPSDRRAALPRLVADDVREVALDADHLAVFSAAARAQGMHVSVCEAPALSATICAALEKHAARRVVLEHAVAALPGVREHVAEAFELLPADAGDESLYTADAGVTTVRAGVAETGSIVVVSGAGHWRGLSLLPPIHVAVLDAAEIVADLWDFFDGLAGEAHTPTGLPSNVTIISGPSKTADIEGILVKGVHGPREVEIVVVHRQEQTGG